MTRNSVPPSAGETPAAPPPDPWEMMLLEMNAIWKTAPVGGSFREMVRDWSEKCATERQHHAADLAERDNEYITGRIVAYCDQVKRGMKLASEQSVRREHLADALALITGEGCLSHVIDADGAQPHVSIWIFADAAVLSIIEALLLLPYGSLRTFTFGKLCGYPDPAVVDFQKRLAAEDALTAARGEIARLTEENERLSTTVVVAYEKARQGWDAQCFTFTSAPESMRRAAHEVGRDCWRDIYTQLGSDARPVIQEEYSLANECAALQKRADAAEASLLALQQQMEAIEAVVRQEFCPQENSDPDGYPDDEPVPAYVSMSEDGVPIIEADTLADVVSSVAGLFTRLEDRHEKLQQQMLGAADLFQWKHYGAGTMAYRVGVDERTINFSTLADARKARDLICELRAAVAAHLTGGPA